MQEHGGVVQYSVRNMACSDSTKVMAVTTGSVPSKKNHARTGP